jgi:hypothetical protein
VTASGNNEDGRLFSFAQGVLGPDVSVKVEARDGTVGKVVWASYAAGESYLVVSLRHHFRGTHRVIPAAAVASVSVTTRTVTLHLARAEVDRSPEHDPTSPPEAATVDFLAGLWPAWLSSRRE